jgi:hypothetical protein
VSKNSGAPTRPGDGPDSIEFSLTMPPAVSSLTHYLRAGGREVLLSNHRVPKGKAAQRRPFAF